MAEQRAVVRDLGHEIDIAFVTAMPPIHPQRPGTNPQRRSTLYIRLGVAHGGVNRSTMWIEQVAGFDLVRGDELVLGGGLGGWFVTGTRGGYLS